MMCTHWLCFPVQSLQPPSCVVVKPKDVLQQSGVDGMKVLDQNTQKENIIFHDHHIQ